MALANIMGKGRRAGLGENTFLYIYLLCSGRPGWKVEPMRCRAELLPRAHTGHGADFGLDPITAFQQCAWWGLQGKGQCVCVGGEGAGVGWTAIAPLFSQITNLYRRNGCLRLSEKSIDSN